MIGPDICDTDFAVDTIIKKFADDTKLYGQRSLESEIKWGNEFQMLFNLSKCKVLHVGKSNFKHQ